MIPIRYVTGDATAPEGDGIKIIAHICNDIGAWGAGFVLALSAKSEWPEDRYRYWFQFGSELPRELGGQPLALGEIQFAPFWEKEKPNPDVYVCNMIAQHGTGQPKCTHCTNGQHDDHGDCIHCNGTGFIPPIRYGALKCCLRNLATAANLISASVHMPRIGCGLAGGRWDKVQPIIMQELGARNVGVTVYDLPALPRLDRQGDWGGNA